MGFCLLFCSNLNLGIYFKSLENLLPGSSGMLCRNDSFRFIFTFSACSPRAGRRELTEKHCPGTATPGLPQPQCNI